MIIWLSYVIIFWSGPPYLPIIIPQRLVRQTWVNANKICYICHKDGQHQHKDQKNNGWFRYFHCDDISVRSCNFTGEKEKSGKKDSAVFVLRPPAPIPGNEPDAVYSHGSRWIYLVTFTVPDEERAGEDGRAT